MPAIFALFVYSVTAQAATIVLECPNSIVAGVRSEVRAPWEAENSRFKIQKIEITDKNVICFYGGKNDNPDNGFLRARIPRGVNCVRTTAESFSATCSKH